MHRPVVVPTIAAALVIGVIVQAVGSQNALAIGERFATGIGIVVGSVISYLSALPTRIVFDAVRGVVTWQHFGWPGRVRGERALGEVTGVEVTCEHRDLPEDDPSRRQPDISLAKNILGWVPEVDLHDGLTRTAEWMRTIL